MKKISKEMLKVAERAMRKEAIGGIDVYLPVCSGLIHQPKRPTIRKNKQLS